MASEAAIDSLVQFLERSKVTPSREGRLVLEETPTNLAAMHTALEARLAVFSMFATDHGIPTVHYQLTRAGISAVRNSKRSK